MCSWLPKPLLWLKKVFARSKVLVLAQAKPIKGENRFRTSFAIILKFLIIIIFLADSSKNGLQNPKDGDTSKFFGEVLSKYCSFKSN